MIRIISDIHLGANPSFAHPRRVQLLLKHLQDWTDTEILVLAGDIFEFWMEYKHVIPKIHFEFFYALKKLMEKGVKIHYVSGNHDFELGSFFQNMGIQCHHSGEMELEWGGRKIFIGHGDGWAKSDWKYRIVRKIIRSPINQFLYKLLHPDWGMGLAYWVGSRSRAAGKEEQIPWEEYQTTAQDKMNEGFDIVVQGHLHHSKIHRLQGGVWAVNGPWLDQLCWLEITTSGIISKKVENHET